MQLVVADSVLFLHLDTGYLAVQFIKIHRTTLCVLFECLLCFSETLKHLYVFLKTFFF